MKTANEIAQMTVAANHRMIAERHDRTMTYINNAMSREIEKHANNGEVYAKFKVSADVDRDTIEQVFTEQGFEVTIKGCEVKISWFHQYFTIRG